jgi:phosphatidylglycerophosphate synthase
MIRKAYPSSSLPTGAVALSGGFLAQISLLAPLLAAGRTRAFAVAAAVAVYALIAVLVWRGRDRGRFGLANAVTAFRAGLIAVLPAMILVPDRFDTTGAWAVVGVGLLALALDGLDGRIARRRNEASAFGARFDMEVDAAYVLFLSGLVAATGRAGVWIILAGLMRYLWVMASVSWPALDRPLPPSRFRKSVCVMVLLLLLAALVPIAPSGLSVLCCVAAMALLLASFGRDLVWLLRRPGMATIAPHHIH